MNQTCLICGRVDDGTSVTCPACGEASWATVDSPAPVDDSSDAVKAKKKAKQ